MKPIPVSVGGSILAEIPRMIMATALMSKMINRIFFMI